MAAAKFRSAPKFEGELAQPIFASLDMSDDGRSFAIGHNFYLVLETRIRKLTALAKHYGVKPDNGLGLALAMAVDLVPGFQVLYDDPRARALKLPGAYHGTGRKPKGTGAIPEVLNGIVLISIFSLFKSALPKRNETELAKQIILCVRPELAGIAKEKERARAGKTLRNRLSEARRAAATKP